MEQYSIEQAAILLNINKQKLRAMIERGSINGCVCMKSANGMKRSFIIPKIAIDNFVKGNTKDVNEMKDMIKTAIKEVFEEIINERVKEIIYAQR